LEKKILEAYLPPMEILKIFSELSENWYPGVFKGGESIGDIYFAEIFHLRGPNFTQESSLWRFAHE
jgi:hypothetical protein